MTVNDIEPPSSGRSFTKNAGTSGYTSRSVQYASRELPHDPRMAIIQFIQKPCSEHIFQNHVRPVARLRTSRTFQAFNTVGQLHYWHLTRYNQRRQNPIRLTCGPRNNDAPRQGGRHLEECNHSSKGAACRVGSGIDYKVHMPIHVQDIGAAGNVVEF